MAVLSNNDGCIIARSQEVKDLGIPMGAPFFKHQRRAGGLWRPGVLSSNYALYGDMSRRVMGVLETFTPDVEPYSIDEAFLSVATPEGTPEAVCAEMERRAREIRARVLRWTGIPVRVSFAETKTLAKAASEWAKERLRAGERAVRVPVGAPRARGVAGADGRRRRVGRGAPVGEEAGRRSG